MSLREEVEPVVCISQTTNRDRAFKAAIVSLTSENTEQETGETGETGETDDEVASLWVFTQIRA